LAKGDFVVAVARGILDVQAQEANDAPPNKIWTHERCLAVCCDVRLKAQVEAAVKQSLDRFDQLDIVVKYGHHLLTLLTGISCAGWGILAACEEQTDFEVRAQFETNVYGTFNVIRQTLPILRGRETARYINLTSTSTWVYLRN
jgi:NAD(P)-dependent dehydrogenase (short-subunit alcohol dehydrogenase family)